MNGSGAATPTNTPAVRPPAKARLSSTSAGSNNWSNDPVGFADHLSSDLNQTISSASTAPGSSDSGGGSSGGGSSGGGGGGGGGGGW